MDTDSRERDYEYTTLMNMLRVSVSKHLLNEHFSLVWANDFYYELIGYTKEEYEILYHNQCDSYYSNDELGIHDEEDWERLGGVVTKALEEGRSGYSNIGRIRKKNGEYALVQMTATFVDDYIDGCQVSYTAMTDVTDIIQQQREQSVTYDNLPGFVAKCRVGGEQGMELLEANSRFYDFFGEGDALFRENLKQNADVVELYRKKFQSREAVHFVARCINRDGKEAWLQVNAACLDSLGEEPLYLFLFIDITNETELRQMQEKLEKQAQELKTALRLAERANRAKSDFLSHMSHDIRTPINGVMGMTSIAMQNADDPERVLDCLKKIEGSSRHLLSLVNDVLDMSRIESGRVSISHELMDIRTVADHCTSIISSQLAGRNVEFISDFEDFRHPNLMGDELHLRQILLNILGNAAKFVKDGGKIIFRMKERAESDGKVIYHFEIEDTGIGMKPEFLPHIWDAFSQENGGNRTNYKGTGLGMAITKQFVDLMGGTIAVESEWNVGSRFTVELPFAIADEPVKAEEEEYKKVVLSGMRILLVEDNELNMEIAQYILENSGIEVKTAENGQIAVELFQKNAPGTFDAILMDVTMPVMDGLTATRVIRGLERTDAADIPIIAMTANAYEEDIKKARDAGMNLHLSKPINADDLLKELGAFKK